MDIFKNFKFRDQTIQWQSDKGIIKISNDRRASIRLRVASTFGTLRRYDGYKITIISLRLGKIDRCYLSFADAFNLNEVWVDIDSTKKNPTWYFDKWYTPRIIPSGTLLTALKTLRDSIHDYLYCWIENWGEEELRMKKANIRCKYSS